MEAERLRSAASSEVARYYGEKTARILDKYGPGPRVHYHTGISEGRSGKDPGLKDLSASMSRAQELVLDMLAKRTRPALPIGREAEVLDVGCGLGGGSIYLAQELGARVTGITIVPEHLRVARDLAARAGASDRVEFLEADAHSLPGEGLFDAAWAIESSCYMDRGAWLERMAGLLRPGAALHIFDWMRGNDEEAAARADEHWKSRMGEPGEYVRAAKDAGLELLEQRSLNRECSGFWTLAREWDLVALRAPGLSPEERARLERSAESIAQLESAFRSGGVLSMHMIMRRPLSAYRGTSAFRSFR